MKVALHRVFQGFHLGCRGPAGGVARLGHKQASRAAYLIRGCVHVRCDSVHLVSTQDSGESLLEDEVLLG